MKSIGIILFFLLAFNNTSTVQIQIRDTDKNLTDAKLEIYQSKKLILEYQTQGYFKAENFPYGNYDLYITKCGKRQKPFKFQVFNPVHAKVIIVDKCQPQ